VILGIAYHSPIDVVTLLPVDTIVSVDSRDEVDVLISDYVVDTYNAKLQLVFASSRVLSKKNLPIIDQGPWGKIINLTGNHFEKILNKKKRKETENAQSSIPEWVRF
jgi:hypothetical protein